MVLQSTTNETLPKITKAILSSYFTGEPSKAKRAIEILSKCNIIDFKKWVLLPIEWVNYDCLNEEEAEPQTAIEKFSWRYGKRFNTTFKSYWQLLINISNWKRYDAEEYFNLLLAECKKDKFWAKVITEEMVLRKVVLLDKQFWHKIPKKVWDMDSVANIF